MRTHQGHYALADPSGLKLTTDRRGIELQNDLDRAIARSIQRIAQGNINDPIWVNRIVDDELGQFNDQAKAKVLKWVADTQQRAVLRSTDAMNAAGLNVQVQLGPSYISDDVTRALQANVQNDIDSLSADAKAKVTRALIDGIGEGEGSRQLAKRVSDETSLPRSRALTIARTETMKAYNDTATDQYRRYGVSKVKWLTANDERLCEECAAHDAEEYPIDEAPDCPAHPNCRCVLLPVISEVS